MLLATLNAYVGRIIGRRAGHLSDMVRIEVDYELSNVTGSFTFEVPVADARLYFVGKRLTIEIREGWEPTGETAVAMPAES